MSGDKLWLLIGLLGQSIFSARFILQWMISEKQRRSVIPHGFWFLSLFGGATLLFYAIHQRDLVFIVGQAAGLFIYCRNLLLIYREQRTADFVQSSGTKGV